MKKKIEEDEFFIKFGENLRKIFKAKSINISLFAKNFGFTQSHISQIFKADRHLAFYTAVKIAKALNVSLDSLINFNASEQYLNHESVRRIENIDQGLQTMNSRPRKLGEGHKAG